MRLGENLRLKVGLVDNAVIVVNIKDLLCGSFIDLEVVLQIKLLLSKIILAIHVNLSLAIFASI